MRPCFKFTAKTATKPAVLALDEEIGFWGTQAKDFRAQLDAVEGNELHVEINSPGGDVMAGLGMYNMLRTWASRDGHSLTTRVTGVAASIASIIALAGDRREMPKNAFAMTHQVMGGAFGTADDLEGAASAIRKITGSLQGIYVDRMGVDEAKAAEMMAKDNWHTADECLEMGFATNLTDEVKATAKFDLGRADLPAHVAKQFKNEAPADEADVDPENPDADPVVPDSEVATQIVEAVNKAGLQFAAAHIAVACTDMAQAKARIDAGREIVALCKVVGHADDAKGFVIANKSLTEVRAALAEKMAKDADDTPVNTVKKQAEQQTANGPTTTNMWERHEKATNAARGKK